MPLLRILDPFNHGTMERFLEVNNILIHFTIQKITKLLRVLAVPQDKGFYSFLLIFYNIVVPVLTRSLDVRCSNQEFCGTCMKQRPGCCSLLSYQFPMIFRIPFSVPFIYYSFTCNVTAIYKYRCLT